MLSLDDIFKFLTRTNEQAAEIFRHPNTEFEESLNEWYYNNLFRHALATQKLGGINFQNFAAAKLNAIIKKFD